MEAHKNHGRIWCSCLLSTVDLPSVCYKSFGSGDGQYVYIYIYTSRKEYSLSFLNNFGSFTAEIGHGIVFCFIAC